MSQDNQTDALFGQTPWQTVGPFFHYGLAWKGAENLVDGSTTPAPQPLLVAGHDHLPTHRPGKELPGEPITLRGQVLDGQAEPVPDALLELWQANADGHYEANLALFGRCSTDANGCFSFRTIRPGPVIDWQQHTHAPHITIGVFDRGLIKRLLTRMYFPDHAANADDPVLGLVPAARRGTLIAKSQADALQFDIILQGNQETVFFRC